jgi:hypothetical protein
LIFGIQAPGIFIEIGWFSAFRGHFSISQSHFAMSQSRFAISQKSFIIGLPPGGTLLAHRYQDQARFAQKSGEFA